MKYTIEMSKIIEGALKYDRVKVVNYTQMLIDKLQTEGEQRSAVRFKKILESAESHNLQPMGLDKVSALPVENESRTMLADVVYPDDNHIEVILSQNNADKLASFLLNYRHAEKLYAAGISLVNTLLMYGPPGCGKTKCAYFIAKQLNMPLVIARLDSLISSFLGTTAKNIRSLFEFVQKIPCVLFLDEFDAIAKARDDNNELGELKRVVNSLLQNIDLMSKDSIVIAATNHQHLLDPAVWRRFEYKLEIGLPDATAIKQMIQLFSHQHVTFDEKTLDEFVAAFAGLSGANIEAIMNKAVRFVVVHDLPLSKSQIYQELFVFKNVVPDEATTNKQALVFKAKFLRGCDSKLFSLQTIANILDCSKTTIQKILSED